MTRLIRLRSVLVLPIVLVALSLLALACDGDDDGGEATGTAEADSTAEATGTAHAELHVDPDAPVVNADLGEFFLTLDADEEAGGDITFSAENSGTIPHNFYIFRTDLPVAELPVEGGRVPEEGADGVEFLGEIPTFDPGQTREGTFDLEPGNYALLCNIPGHYEAGMFAGFTVE